MNESDLAYALRFSSAAEVRLLLEGGADPNASGVFHISKSEFTQKIEVLLEHGWDINQCQLLHDAKHGFGKRVEFYLSMGADPSVVDEGGQNALHKFACLGIGRSPIEALVRAGADLAMPDNEGRTPLELARKAKRRVAEEVISKLLAKQLRQT